MAQLRATGYHHLDGIFDGSAVLPDQEIQSGRLPPLLSKTRRAAKSPTKLPILKGFSCV